jgi:hypothetical protein
MPVKPDIAATAMSGFLHIYVDARRQTAQLMFVVD